MSPRCDQQTRLTPSERAEPRDSVESIFFFFLLPEVIQPPSPLFSTHFPPFLGLIAYGAVKSCFCRYRALQHSARQYCTCVCVIHTFTRIYRDICIHTYPHKHRHTYIIYSTYMHRLHKHRHTYIHTYICTYTHSLHTKTHAYIHSKANEYVHVCMQSFISNVAQGNIISLPLFKVVV